MTEMKFDPL